MANIKSQEKRTEIYARNAKFNGTRKAEIRTASKKVELLANEGKKEEAEVALRAVVSLLDKYSQDGAITVNSANRKKAHLARIVREIK